MDYEENMLIDENTDEESENENSIKISRYAFNSFGVERSVRDLISWEERGKVYVPKFQRNFVWDFNKCCKFVESILLNLPTPTMFMFRDRSESETEKYILIDGLQRFTCIKQFVDGKYDNGIIQKEFKINIKNSEWYKATYSSLSQSDKDSFDDYSFKVNVFDSVNSDENIKKKYMTEIFERINTGSDKLTDQEIRNAIYASDATESIKVAANNQKLKNMLSFSKKYGDNRCNDQEFILRCLTYYYIYTVYKNGDNHINTGTLITTSKKNMMTEYLYLASKNVIDYKSHLQYFDCALDFLYGYDDSIYKGVSIEKKDLTDSIHEVFSEAIMIYLMLGKKINITKEEFAVKKIDYWLKTPSELNPFYTKTTSKDSILKRIEVLESFMEE